MSIAVGALCIVLPERVAEAAFALHPKLEFGEAQRACCGKLGVAVRIGADSVLLQFTGTVGSQLFPTDAISADADADAEAIAERLQAEREAIEHEAQLVADARKAELADCRAVLLELLDAATARVFARLAERRRIDAEATKISAAYRGYLVRRRAVEEQIERETEKRIEAQEAEQASANADMETLLEMLGGLEKSSAPATGNSKASALRSKDAVVRAASARAARTQLGPPPTEGFNAHNALVTALLEEAGRSGGGRVLFRAPSATRLLDLSGGGGGSTGWGGLRLPWPRRAAGALLTGLDLSGANLGDTGAEGLAAGIFGTWDGGGGACALREIRLANCALGPEGVTSIAGCLPACAALRLLDLRGNSAGAAGGFALAAAVSTPRSMLAVLAFDLNRAFDHGTGLVREVDGVPSPPYVPWSREEYQSVVEAFAAALPASALTDLDIGYASTESQEELLDQVHAAQLPEHCARSVFSSGSGSGSTPAVSAGSWLGLAADVLCAEIAAPLGAHAHLATLAARQRLAWASIASYGPQPLGRGGLRPRPMGLELSASVAARVAALIGRPVLSLDDYDDDEGDVEDKVEEQEERDLYSRAIGVGPQAHHYECVRSAAVRAGASTDAPLLGRTLQVGEVVAGLELEDGQLRFLVPNAPLIGRCGWVSLRAPSGRDVLRPLSVAVATSTSTGTSLVAATLGGAGLAGLEQAEQGFDADKRAEVDSARMLALQLAAARHLAAVLLRQRSSQSHASKAEHLIAFVTPGSESPRKRRPGSAGGLDSKHLAEAVPRRLKRARSWLLLSCADDHRRGEAVSDRLLLRIRLQQARKVHRIGDDVTLRLCDEDDHQEEWVEWEAVVEEPTRTEWAAQVAAVASRLVEDDCPLASLLSAGAGWACVRSLFKHRERQEKAMKQLETAVAEAQDAMAKLGVGGRAKVYRASLEARRQASLDRLKAPKEKRPASASSLSPSAAAARAEAWMAAKVDPPHPMSKPEVLLEHAVQLNSDEECVTAGGLWSVAHRDGATLLTSPRLDSDVVGVLPQGSVVETLNKTAFSVELPPERVAKVPPFQSERTVRRHASLLRTSRGWVVQRVPNTDAVVLAAMPWDQFGPNGGRDLLRTLRRKEVERLTTATEERRLAATKLQRWHRRCVVASRTAMRREALAEMKSVEGLITVNLKKPLALAPTVALHLEDQAHELASSLAAEAKGQRSGALRFLRPGSAGAAGRAVGAVTFARELQHALEFSRDGQLQQAMDGAEVDPAIGLALATEIAGLARRDDSAAMAAALRADLATRRHPPRAMRAAAARVEAKALASVQQGRARAAQQKAGASLSIFRAPVDPRQQVSRPGLVEDSRRRRRRRRAEEAEAAELRRLAGDLDSVIAKGKPVDTQSSVG